MPVNLAGAYKPQTAPAADIPKIELEGGVHAAHFIGLGETFWTNDRFKGCDTCGMPNPENAREKKKGSGIDSHGKACVPCGGTGMLKTQQVAIRYTIDHTGEVFQEVVSYKLSAPFKMRDGQTSKASNLYLRFKTFSGKTDPDEILAWAHALPEEIAVPVTIVIEITEKGYPKIAAVIKTPSAAPQTTQVFKPKSATAAEEDEIPF